MIATMRYSDDNMFDEEADLHRTDSQAAPFIANFKELSLDDQLLVRMAVNALCPVNAADIDLEQEIAEQLRNAQFVMTEVLTNTRATASQKTSALTAVNRALQQLTALQSKTFNINRIKALEKSLTTTLQGHEDGEALLAMWRSTFQRMVNSQ